ncbi:MAG: hypothetical protein Q9202_005399 [Teloschistes flavicans]
MRNAGSAIYRVLYKIDTVNTALQRENVVNGPLCWTLLSKITKNGTLNVGRYERAVCAILQDISPFATDIARAYSSNTSRTALLSISMDFFVGFDRRLVEIYERFRKGTGAISEPDDARPDPWIRILSRRLERVIIQPWQR